MDQRIIKDMVLKLAPILKDKIRAEIILKNYWSRRMALVWSIEDVHRAANELEVALTRKEAITVLQILCQQHNPQFGLKWEDLTTHIQDRVLGRPLTKTEINRFVELDQITVQK